MEIFFITFIILIVIVTIMSLGVMLMGKNIKGSCGGLNAISGSDKCTICNKQTEEVHHIEEQHLANSEGMINHYHKNKLFNLVQLCHNCHQEVHNGNLVIKGYRQTSEGIELDYSYEDKKQVTNKRKFNNDQIEIIKDIYEKNKNYSKSRKLLDQKGIQISTTTIKKIVNGNY